jgi:preprotein translocase subunit SecG
MGVFKVIIVVIHILVSLALVVSVLLHSGKGGGLASVLGGASSSLFSGSYIIEKNLDRITIVLGLVFATTTLLLVWLMNPSSAATAPTTTPSSAAAIARLMLTIGG